MPHFLAICLPGQFHCLKVLKTLEDDNDHGYLMDQFSIYKVISEEVSLYRRG